MTLKDEFNLIKQRRKRHPLYVKLRTIPIPMLGIGVALLCLITVTAYTGKTSTKALEDATQINTLAKDYKAIQTKVTSAYLDKEDSVIYYNPDTQKKLEAIQTDLKQANKIYNQLDKEGVLITKRNRKTEAETLNTSAQTLTKLKKQTQGEVEYLASVVQTYTDLNAMYTNLLTDPALNEEGLQKGSKVKDDLTFDEYQTAREKYYTEKLINLAVAPSLLFNRVLDDIKTQLANSVTTKQWIDDNYPNQELQGKATTEKYNTFKDLVNSVTQQKHKEEYSKTLASYKKEVDKQVKLDQEEAAIQQAAKEAADAKEAVEKAAVQETERRMQQAQVELERLEAERLKIQQDINAATNQQAVPPVEVTPQVPDTTPQTEEPTGVQEEPETEASADGTVQ